jgi:NADPH:quinone reductase-like Zn-dependent oxidoreductase
MKAIQLKEYGGPDQLVEVTVPKPQAHAGQVVVRVIATSLNPIDPKRASGSMRQIFPLEFPFIPGSDLSGVIDSVGDGVSGFQAGDEVYGGAVQGGSYAEFVAVEADKVALKPRILTHIEAASLATVAQTAVQALDRAGLEKGQTILIQGAGGAVGSVAVQLAHLRGAHIIASASAASAARLWSYGANEVVDYRVKPFEVVAKDVDVVLDTVGGEVQLRSYRVLKPGGVLIAISQTPSQQEAEKHQARASFFVTDIAGANLRALTGLIEAGQIRPSVGRTYPLSDAATAWRDSSSDHVQGKIVLTTGA